MEPKETKETQPKKRWITRRRALGVMLGGAGACVADAFFIEPRWLSLTRKEIICPGLPKGLDGLKVGVLCDIHYQPGSSDGLLESAVTKLMAEKPDMILMPGDFVDQRDVDLAPMMRILSRLKAPHGVYASMGNHDGWNEMGYDLKIGFDKVGISLLINSHTRLQIKGEGIAVAATDHVWLGSPAPARTLQGIPAEEPVMVMVHEPDYFDEIIQLRPITLQVSGHSHGGQCQVPFIGYAPKLPEFARNYVEGVYEKGDSRLFVSRGIGLTGLPVRFACRPEVAVLTLRSPKA